MVASVEDGRLILPAALRNRHRPALAVPDPTRSVALLAVVLIHAAAIAALATYKVAPRFLVPEPLIVATLVPEPPRVDETDPTLPTVNDWQPALPDEPLPQVVMTEVSTAITLPPPHAAPQPIPAERVAEGEVPPMLDAQAVGYLVPPAPRYPPVSRRMREEGEVLVRVLIDVEGRPTEVHVLRSSGYDRLDDAALTAVRSAQFRPYVSAGRARAAYVRVPVEFALRRG